VTQGAPSNPTSAGYWSNLGASLANQGLINEAIDAFQKSVAIRPSEAVLWSNLGRALYMARRIDESTSVCGEAVRLNPNLGEAHNNLGNALRAGGNFDGARLAYEKAASLRGDDPGVHWNLVHLYLQLGDYRSAWRHHDLWLKYSPEPPYRCDAPMWLGEPISGKRILLQHEGGFGDVFQYCRYAPLIRELGGRVVLRCHPDMIELLKSLDGFEEIVPNGTPVETDFCCPMLLSVERALQITVATIPATVPYLHADLEKVSRLKASMSSGQRRVGIAWISGLEERHFRNIPAENLLPLRECDARFYSLQKSREASIKELRDLGIDFATPPLELRDWSDTAALIANLDLVISIDAGVAHLVGAMGKAAWVMLPFSPDHRWLLHREDSPYYPTMRLFRQEKRDDWSGPIGRIAQELRCRPR
jgi:tetratricopeptide (TPR) repeat protein